MKLKKHLISSCLLALIVIASAPAAQGGGERVQRVYYPDGAIKAEFSRQGGKLNGETKWYHENGSLGALLQYHDNQLHGETRVYDEDGHLKKLMNMEYNKPEGPAEIYRRNGALAEKIFFKDGTEQIRFRYDETGRMSSCYESQTRTGEKEPCGDFASALQHCS